jgi:Heterokaryon incompatibility protein (HET)
VLVDRSGKKGEYVALSHCWGLSADNPYDQQYVTNSDTLSSRLRGMPMAELPKTFQDAVVVTRELGLRYLWIDSLCIVQDSKVEMQQEIQKMALVYGNATVTISATSAGNSTSGFLARDPRSDPVITLPFALPNRPLSGSLRLYRRESQRTWDMDVESSEWNQRAWTFQERILSSRVLHFAKNKLYFECCSGDTDEDRTPSRRPIYDYTFTGDTTLLARFLGYFQHFSRQGGLELDQVYKSYYELAAAYSKRDLTFHQDREAAFSAIAYQFQSLLMSENIGGLWVDDASYGLLWTRKQDKWWKNEAHSLAGKKDLDFQALDSLLPSWSWYSTRGEVYWPKRTSIFPKRKALYKPDDLMRFEPSERSPGKLQVLAYITSGYHDYHSVHNRGKISVNDKYFCYPDFDSIHAATTSGPVLMLRLPSPTLDGYTYDHGLLIEGNEEEGCFKRVGTFHLGFLMKRRPNGNWVEIPAAEELKWITLV